MAEQIYGTHKGKKVKTRDVRIKERTMILQAQQKLKPPTPPHVHIPYSRGYEPADRPHSIDYLDSTRRWRSASYGMRPTDIKKKFTETQLRQFQLTDHENQEGRVGLETVGRRDSCDGSFLATRGGTWRSGSANHNTYHEATSPVNRARNVWRGELTPHLRHNPSADEMGNTGVQSHRATRTSLRHTLRDTLDRQYKFDEENLGPVPAQPSSVKLVPSGVIFTLKPSEIAVEKLREFASYFLPLCQSRELTEKAVVFIRQCMRDKAHFHDGKGHSNMKTFQIWPDLKFVFVPLKERLTLAVAFFGTSTQSMTEFNRKEFSFTDHPIAGAYPRSYWERI